MKLSLNWIKQYTDVNLSIDELVQKIGAQIGEVESVEDLSAKYKGLLIVKVVSCEKHANADKLNVCRVDDGGVAQNVERGDDGLVQVVCGAPNVHADMLAVWLAPGVTVPDSFDKEPFVLEARELRGVVSNGMLASQRELALGDSHDGILEINPNEWSPRQKDIKPGADFAEVFGLNDHIIDIENKMFTHRPDLFGQLGLAREVAGIQNQQFTSPDWYAKSNPVQNGSGLELNVTNEAQNVVPRLMAVAVKNVTVKASPLWLQCELVRVGAKPINNIVDVTNYIMLLTSQPTHAYDYDKLQNHKLVARQAKDGEKITLLNHKTYNLTAEDIVIADGAAPIGLAGIMGGGDSEVSNETKNIVLECANFDMYAVRRMSMRHGVFTDALTRFNKGQSPLQNHHVLSLLVQSVSDVAGGEVASAVVDEPSYAQQVSVHPSVQISPEFINSRLGLQLDATYISDLLTQVEFDVQQNGENLTITAPFWRTDIERREDIVEEVGRLHGYDNLPLKLPSRSIAPAAPNALLVLKDRVRSVLAKAGANEVLTYSFVHGDLLTKAGQDPAKAFQVSNALSPDLQYYRLSLTPSLLDKIHPNQKAGYNELALFELGKAHNLDHADDDNGLPMEFEMLDTVYSSTKTTGGAAYYQAQALLRALCDELHIPIELRPIAHEEDYQVAKPYDHSRSAQIFVAGTDLPLGMIGEYKASVRRQFKLPVQTAGFGIGLLQLQQALKQAKTTSYQPLSRFPKLEQDICFKVDAGMSYRELESKVGSFLAENKPEQTQLHVSALDIYQRKDDLAHKQITFRVRLVNFERTMVEAELTKLLDQLAAQLAEDLNAERV